MTQEPNQQTIDELKAQHETDLATINSLESANDYLENKNSELIEGNYTMTVRIRELEEERDALKASALCYSELNDKYEARIKELEEKVKKLEEKNDEFATLANIDAIIDRVKDRRIT